MASPFYTDGMKAYDAGDFKKAAKNFSKYLKTSPNDGYALWYVKTSNNYHEKVYIEGIEISTSSKETAV